MLKLDCPMCGKAESLRFYVKTGYGVDFDLKKSNETVLCDNCKRRISYSVQKSENN